MASVESLQILSWSVILPNEMAATVTLLLTVKGYRLKVSTFIYRHLHGHDQQRFTV